MAYDYVFWDWNGTLIDDMSCSLKAVNSMLEKRGKTSITDEQYFAYIDTPIIRFYEHIFDFTEIGMDEIMDDFNHYYSLYIDESPLMRGAEAVLEELNIKGCMQLVLSSSPNEFILPLAEKTGIKRFFTHILGATDRLVNGKTERAVSFVQKNSINPCSCVVIGDTLHDYDTACAIGCDCILIPNGHQSKDDLIKPGATIAEDIFLIPKMLF